MSTPSITYSDPTKPRITTAARIHDPPRDAPTLGLALSNEAPTPPLTDIASTPAMDCRTAR